MTGPLAVALGIPATVSGRRHGENLGRFSGGWEPEKLKTWKPTLPAYDHEDPRARISEFQVFARSHSKGWLIHVRLTRLRTWFGERIKQAQSTESI
jgi:hypothetical protein